MQILSHRGWWQTPEEKNTPDALGRALAEGFGVETDIRDLAGQLVISHDPPLGETFRLDEFLELCSKYPQHGFLALNIKSDGLQPALALLLERHATQRYFVFDMSLPELIRYRIAGIHYFTRLSDHEPDAQCLPGAAGIWVDGFNQDWADWGRLEKLLHAQPELRLALVSPELHRRDRAAFWGTLRSWLSTLPTERQDRIMLCTDHPGEANEYFYG